MQIILETISSEFFKEQILNLPKGDIVLFRIKLHLFSMRFSFVLYFGKDLGIDNFKIKCVFFPVA